MSTSNKPTLIGLAGTFAAGKDTISHRLEADFGYRHVSTSEMVRRLARKNYGSIERPILVKTADKLRHQNGAGALVIEALKQPVPLIVSGLRSLGEAKAIKEAGGLLVFVDAPAELRYERMRARDRDTETKLSLEEFIAGEQREWHAGDEDADFNLQGIKMMSDHVIDSSKPIDEFVEEAYRAFGLYD